MKCSIQNELRWFGTIKVWFSSGFLFCGATNIRTGVWLRTWSGTGTLRVQTGSEDMLVSARAEKSHTGWRLFHRHSEEIGRDICNKHVLQEAPGRTPVRLCVRLVCVVAKAPPAVAQVKSSCCFWFAAAGFVWIAGAELIHAPARIPVLQSRASGQSLLHHAPCRKSAALSSWRSSVFDSVSCTFNHTSDAS